MGTEQRKNSLFSQSTKIQREREGENKGRERKTERFVSERDRK
jgi:hypothetical protein